MIEKAFVTFMLILFLSQNNATVMTEEMKIVKIGAIFDKPSIYKERVFYLTIKQMNERLSPSLKVEGIKEVIPYDNPFEAEKASCKLIEAGVVAILGPTSEENSNIVQAICDKKEIPHLDVRWDDQLLAGISIVNIHPYQMILTKVYVEILQTWNYKDFVILYENNESLKRVGRLLNIYPNQGYRVIVRQLDNTAARNHRAVLKELARSGATYFVLDCSTDVLEDVLQQAQQVGLITHKYHFLVTNLDFHTLDLNSYFYGDTNITGLRFINPEDEAIKELAYKIYFKNESEDLKENAGWSMQLDIALINDVLLMFEEALKFLPMNSSLQTMNCYSSESSVHGLNWVNYMKGLKYPGLTGLVKFNELGYRSEFGLEIFELFEGGVAQVANWTNTDGLKITRDFPNSPVTGDFLNGTLRVITCETPPYAMLKETSQKLSGNDRFEGFGIDLIHELSLMVGFNYTFLIREDKSNGKYDNKTGKWTGMIGDLIDGNADLAITDLTITSDREEAVDFTTPFMNLGISILYRKPTKAPPSFFSFADPFAWEVWKLLVAAFFFVSISLFIIGRISPSEWTNPYPCVEEPEYLINQLTLRNCFWFITGSIMQQGSEIAPISISSRTIAGFWWFFTLLMVSSYTANLAAFLTTESPDEQFTNVFELARVAEEKGIKYGAKKNGATEKFFKDKTDPIEYKMIAEYMEKNKNEVMVTDNEKGVEKAEKEDFAFFMESTSIEYEIQRRCNLTQVGKPLDEKGYGIAMRKNSTALRHALSTAILKLQSNGKMQDLKRKWWEERRGGGQCAANDDTADATPLNLKNVGGVFWVTIGGSLLACIFVFIEMLLYVIKKSIKTKTPFGIAFKKEIKFYFKLNKMIKPVIYNSSEENSKSSKEETPFNNVVEIKQ